MKRTGSKSTPAKAPMSPAARVLTNRALNKSSPWKSPKQSLAAPQEQSDSDNSTYSHERLVEMLGRQSWKQNLRESVVNPTFEPGRESSERLSSGIKQKSKRTSTQNLSTNRIFLTNADLSEEEESNDDPRISDVSGRHSSNESLGAFKPSGPVRHSDSEDSEIEIRRTKLQRSPRKEGDKRLEALLPAPPVMKTKHIQEEVDSGPESPIKMRRKRKNSTLGNQTRQIDLQLNATEYSVYRIANSESSEVDSPDLKLQKRKKFKKSMKAYQNKYFDLSPLRTSEPRKSNIPCNNDTDSDVDIPLTRKTRAKKSTRGTEIENLNLVLSPSHSERDASTVESSEDEQVRRKIKKTREAKKSGLKISLPSPDKENQVAPADDSETDRSHDDVRKRRSQRTKDKTNTEIQLPQMTPEKSVGPEKVASDVDESPLPVQRRLTRSFKENLGTSQPIILSPAKQSDSLNRIGVLSDQESPVRVTRSRATLHNSTLIQMPDFEESYKEHDDEEESSIDEPLKRKSRRSHRKSPSGLVNLQSLNSPDKVNQHLHTEIHSSDDEAPSIQRRQTRSKNSIGQTAATNLSPAHNSSGDQASSRDESEDIAPKKRALSRKSSGVNVMNLSPLGSPAKQNATKETDQHPEDNDGEPVERKSRQNQRKSTSGLVNLQSLNSPDKVNQHLHTEHSSDDEAPSIQRRQTRSKNSKGQPAATNLSPTHNISGDQASSSDESEDIAPKKRALSRKSTGVSVMNLSPLGSPAKQSATKETDQNPEDNDGEPVERKSRQNQRKSSSAVVDLPALKSPEKVKQYLISQIHSTDEGGPSNLHRQKSSLSTNVQAATINLSPARDTIRSSSSSDESEEIGSRKRVIARKSSRATSMKLSPLKSSPNKSEADQNKGTEHPPDKTTDKLSKSREQIETLVLDENFSEDADSEEEAIVEKRAEIRKSNKEMTLDLPALKEAPSKKTHLTISKRKSIWSASKEKPTQSNLASSKNVPRKSHAAVPESHTVTSQDKDAPQPSDESEEEVIVSRKNPAARMSNNEMTFELSPLASTTLNSRVDLSSKSLNESDHSAVRKPKTFPLKKASLVSETSGGELQRSRIPIEGRPGFPHYQSGPVETAQEKAQRSLQKNSPDTHVNVGKGSSETHEHNNNSDESEEEIDLSSLKRSKESKVMRLSSSLLKNSQIETGTRSQLTFKMSNADQVNTSRNPVAATGSEQALSDTDFNLDWEEDHSDLNTNIPTLSKNHNMGIDSEIESLIDETAGTRTNSRAIELDKNSGVETQDQAENVEHDMQEESATLSDESSINAKRTNLRQKTPNRSTPFKRFTLFSPEKSQNVANDSSDGEEIQPKRQLRKKSESNSLGQTTYRQAEPTHGKDGSSGSSKSDKVRIMENNSERLGKTSGNVESARQTRKLSLFASKQRAQSSGMIAVVETEGEDANKVKRKDTSNLHESSTMELDYSMVEEESDVHSTSKKSIKDPIDMFLASDEDVSNESQNSANVASTETAAQQNAPNNTDSDSENDETPVVFKRRKISYKKSNDQPELSLKLSFRSNETGGKSSKQVETPKPPDVTSLNSKKNSSSKEKDVSEKTASRDEISLTNEGMQRHTMFQYTGDSNVNDILLSAKRVSALYIDPRRSSKTSQQKGESTTSATNSINQKTGSTRKSKFSQENAKRNLQKHLEQAEEEFSQSHKQSGKETEEPRTSTPVGDVSLTVGDVAEVVDLMETNGEQSKNSSEARLYTAEDFKTAFSRFVRPQQSTKSKKIFSLADLERAMVAVRSPSMMIDSSKRDSIQGGKNLFSLQDFERALMKLKNKSVLGARYSLMGMNEISNITMAQSAAASNPAQKPQINETANSAVEERVESRTMVLDTPEQVEDKGENQTVYATPSDPGSDNNDDQKTESESQHTEEESESEHTEVQDSDSENTARTIETSPSVNAGNNSDGSSINDGNLDAQEETKTQEMTENEPDESMLPDPSSRADGINGDSSEEEIVAAKQSSQKKSGGSSGAPLPLHQRIQSNGKHQSLITSFLSQASASARTSVRRSILSSGEISPPPWQHMLGDPDESGVASMKDRELKRTLFLKEHQERKKRIEAKLAAKEKEFSTVKKRVPPSKPTGTTKKTVSKNPTRTNTGFTQPDILKELKRDQWVNKRLINKLDKYFKNGPPRVRNDFLRTLSMNINKVLKQKKVNEANVRKVMRACHKAGVAKDFNEFARFMREYLPTSFETKAFTDKLFREEYYYFE